MASYIQIEGQKIKKGIFSFVSEATGDDWLADMFFEMEKKYYTNRPAFSTQMRKVMEAFVYSEYRRLYGVTYNPSSTVEEALRSINAHLVSEKNGNALLERITSTIKIFFVMRSCKEEYMPMFEKAMRYIREKSRYSTSDLKRAIFDCYSFACEDHHVKPMGVETYNPYEANEENCKKYLGFLYYFMWAYCRIYFPDAMDYSFSLDENMMPIEDYVRVSKTACKSIGVSQAPRKKLYVGEGNNTIQYYWMCDADQEQSQNREIDVLQKIWSEDNDFDPRNVIRLKESYSINETKSKLFFSLPSKPAKLVWENTLEKMSIREREKLFQDAIYSVSSLHNNIPPLFHRDITPEAFVVCRTKNSYKLFLSAFDCVKDTDENANYTVGSKVAQNIGKSKNLPYVAPEVHELKETDEAWMSIDWKAMDIYALGVLGTYILTGQTDVNVLLTEEGISPHIKDKIKCMCANKEQRLMFI